MKPARSWREALVQSFEDIVSTITYVLISLAAFAIFAGGFATMVTAICLIVLKLPVYLAVVIFAVLILGLLTVFNRYVEDD